MVFSNFAEFCLYLQLPAAVVAKVKPDILALAVNSLTKDFSTKVVIRDEHKQLYKAPFFKGLFQLQWPWSKGTSPMTLEAFAREFDVSVEGLIQDTTQWQFIKALSTRELPLDTRASLINRFKTLVCKFLFNDA